MADGPGAPVARVIPDVAGIDREFDYLVPASLAGEVGKGSVVRVPLHGRKVRGWVSEFPVVSQPGLDLLPLERLAAKGPTPDLVDLAGWAAWRWAGRRRSLLVTASAPTLVKALAPPSRRTPARPAGGRTTSGGAAETVLRGAGPGTRLVRVGPATPMTQLVLAAAERGPALVIAPTRQRAESGSSALRRQGMSVALLPEEWARARSGVDVVIGARGAAWGPCADVASIVVLDAHDEGLVQEQAPTWDAPTVAAQRARLLQLPCFWVSACPTLELVHAADEVVAAGPSAEREGWAPLLVADRRGEDPRLGLYSEMLVQAARREAKRVVCVLNRKGRAVLVDCRACGELATCEACGAALTMAGDRLVCPRCHLARPLVCGSCASDALRLARPGVSRAREELEALTGKPAAELTSGRDPLPDGPVLVGTEAVLYRDAELARGGGVGLVAFLDFDQELLAPRYRAGEEALALLARASRLVGGRRKGGRVLVQTRLPGHPVVAAAQRAEPGWLNASEEPVRKALRFPPFSALALLSGPGSSELAGALSALVPSTLEVEPLADQRWVVRAGDHTELADALALAGRPSERVRVEVGPVRF